MKKTEKITMASRSSDKSIDEVFKDFVLNCRIRNLSTRTIDYYETTFGYFSEFYDSKSSTSTITKRITDDYILHLKQKPNLNDISINTLLRGIRVFLYYCMNLGYMEKFKIDFLKTEKLAKESYNDNELQLLLKKPNVKKCQFTEYRNWVIINYLLATGNRADTVINIRICDLDIDNEIIKLQKTKNKKQQLVPMTKTLQKILKEYLQYRQGNTDDYLFCDKFGNKLSYNALRIAINRYNKNRGVVKTSLHLFRHTFARKYLLNGGDIFRLQKLLGHSTLDMVKEYIELFTDDLKRDYESLNPLEQLINNSSSIKMAKK